MSSDDNRIKSQVDVRFPGHAVIRLASTQEQIKRVGRMISSTFSFTLSL